MNNTVIDTGRLASAYEKVRLDLLQEREPDGHWIGELATSALSTATAVSALALVRRREALQEGRHGEDRELRESQLTQLIVRGIHWLAEHQNDDGGWGDTDRSYSNIATTMLAVAACRLTAVPAHREDLLERAEQYISRHGREAGLRKRYGKDRTFAAPILANCAMAGMVSWRTVSPLPFELACLPQKLYRFLQLPVVSYAIPALVAIGQARHFHCRPWNPLTRLVRSFSIAPSLAVLERTQPASGGYLEAVPLTSFVVMSLASMGRISHPVVRRGVEFLQASVRPDGSWPIDTNLATWNTTLALNGLAGGGEEIGEFAPLEWLLDCQYREVHPYTGAAPGGWGWSDLSGSVPDADDTPGALLSLAALRDCPTLRDRQSANLEAVRAGGNWLLDLQNRDGGWPTFCRGWGKLPFDRSGADLTAHALRALHTWRDVLDSARLGSARQRALRYLSATQREDGSWVPLWFGNQDHPEEVNPVYGTAKVLMAYRDLKLLETPEAKRGLMWLHASQNPDGGWGGGASLAGRCGPGRTSSVEETALAAEALLPKLDDPSFAASAARGLEWLIEAVEGDHHLECSPIGFYFAKLWYYEKLYPLSFTVSALGRAVVSTACSPQRRSAPTSLSC